VFLLAHSGITLGAAYAVDKSVRSPALKVDYRFVLLGALLPDIIDKPLGHLFFPQALASGHTFAHTLLFLLLVTLIGIIVYRIKAQQWGRCLAFGVLMHFILDSLWLDPVTLFWPLLSPSFPRHEELDFFAVLNRWLRNLLTSATVFIPEIAGAVILAFFAVRAVAHKKERAFILDGAL